MHSSKKMLFTAKINHVSRVFVPRDIPQVDNLWYAWTLYDVQTSLFGYGDAFSPVDSALSSYIFIGW